MNDEDNRIARRSWLTAVARYAMLTGIGMFAWSLVTRSKEHCFRRSLLCQDCRLLVHCRRANAASARQQTRVEGVQP